MPDTPKIHAYAVALGFGDMNSPNGTIGVGTWMAADPISAAAGMVAAHVQATGEAKKLQGVSVHELTEEALRFMLQQIATGGKPGEVSYLREADRPVDLQAEIPQPPAVPPNMPDGAA